MSPRLLSLLLTLPVAPLAGCTGEVPPPDAAAEAVVVENLRLVQEEDGSRAVRGVVVNEGDEARSVEVVIALYDGANQRIGEVQVPVQDVGPGAEQGFNWTLDRDAAGASVRRIFVR